MLTKKSSIVTTEVRTLGAMNQNDMLATLLSLAAYTYSKQLYRTSESLNLAVSQSCVGLLQPKCCEKLLKANSATVLPLDGSGALRSGFTVHKPEVQTFLLQQGPDASVSQRAKCHDSAVSESGTD